MRLSKAPRRLRGCGFAAAVLGGLSVGAWAGNAGAAVVVSDSFETATHPTGDRTVAAGQGVQWFVRNPTGGSAVIGSDATFGSNALAVTNTSTSAVSYPVTAPLGGVATLANVGDSITVSFSFRFLNAGSVNDGNSNFRFGIHNSMGAPPSADGQQSNTDNDQGYYAAIGDAAQGTAGLFYNEAGGTAPILGGTDRANVAASAGVAAITDANVHTAALTLTRTDATHVGLSLTIDGGAAVTGSDSTANLRTTFDEISFGDAFISGTQLNFALDNVQVDATAFTVPEPGALGLAAAAGLLARRKRVRRPA